MISNVWKLKISRSSNIELTFSLSSAVGCVLKKWNKTKKISFYSSEKWEAIHAADIQTWVLSSWSCGWEEPSLGIPWAASEVKWPLGEGFLWLPDPLMSLSLPWLFELLRTQNQSLGTWHHPLYLFAEWQWNPHMTSWVPSTSLNQKNREQKKLPVNRTSLETYKQRDSLLGSI